MDENLQVKVNRAIKLIQSAGKIAKEHGQPLEVAYSGGKDSDVILELTKMSGEDFPRWYLYKRQFMRMAFSPYGLPDKWKWLKHSRLKLQFEKSFAMSYLYWKKETIDKLHANGGSLF